MKNEFRSAKSLAIFAPKDISSGYFCRVARSGGFVSEGVLLSQQCRDNVYTELFQGRVDYALAEQMTNNASPRSLPFAFYQMLSERDIKWNILMDICQFDRHLYIVIELVAQIFDDLRIRLAIC